MPPSRRAQGEQLRDPPNQSASKSFEPSASRGSGGKCEKRKGKRFAERAEGGNLGVQDDLLAADDRRSVTAPAVVAGSSHKRKSRAREREAVARAEKRAERRGERKAQRREKEREREILEARRHRSDRENSRSCRSMMANEDLYLDRATAEDETVRLREDAIVREQSRYANDVGIYLGVEGEGMLEGLNPGGDGDKPWKSCNEMEDIALIASPSTLCHALSLPARVAAAVLGFLLVYYILFAKHGRYEGFGEVVEGSSRFLRDESIGYDTNTTESNSSVSLVAVPTRPPPIWHQDVLVMLDARRKKEFGEVGDRPVKSNIPINYALEAARAAEEREMKTNEMAKTNPPLTSIESTVAQGPEGTTASTSSTPKSRKKTRKRKRPMRVVNTAPPVTSASSASTMSNPPSSETSDAMSDTISDSNSISGKNDPESSAKISTAMIPSSEQLNESSAPAESVLSDSSVSPGPSSRITETAASKVSHSDESNSTESQTGSSKLFEPSPQDQNDSNMAVPSEHTSEHTAVSNLTATEQRPNFTNLDPQHVPEGEIQLLHWNYEAVLDAGTSSQYFALAGHDHVATFKPLCINPETQKFITKKEPRLCGGYNRTAGWMIQYCSSVEESYDKESNLEKEPIDSDTAQQWLTEQEDKKNVHWVEGLTVLQLYEKNCGNIAHFAGRATMLQHVMDNINAYAAPPHQIENVLIVPTFHIMKRFLYPHNYAFWHKNFLRAILAPSKYTIGTLGNFLYRAGKEAFQGVPRVQLLHNFTMSGSNMPDDTVVCFRQAIVPGYFKDRYFADDREYPSDKISLHSHLPGTPETPRDALRMRERVSALLHKSTEFPGMSKRVVYLDRGGERRKISDDQKEKLFMMLRAATKKRLFKFEVVTFDEKHFKKQVELVETAGIAIGVHGANLVNTMFMVCFLRILSKVQTLSNSLSHHADLSFVCFPFVATHVFSYRAVPVSILSRHVRGWRRIRVEVLFIPNVHRHAFPYERETALQVCRAMHQTQWGLQSSLSRCRASLDRR